MVAVAAAAMAAVAEMGACGDILIGGDGGAGGDGGDGGPGGAGGVVSKSDGDDDDDGEVGFVIGTGLDVKLTEHVSIGMEGLYYFFDDDKVDFFVDEDRVDDTDIDNDFAVVRARLSFHWPCVYCGSPVPAK